MTGRDHKLPSVLVLAQDGRTAPLRTLAKAMDFRVIAIDTGSEKQEMSLNTLGGEEIVDFAKGIVVANVKSITGGLGITISSFSL